jgi:hypothetical protein
LSQKKENKRIQPEEELKKGQHGRQFQPERAADVEAVEDWD